MGNFEKLVVLTVLFLSAIVLAFNLNDSDVDAAIGDPSRDAERFLARSEDPSVEAGWDKEGDGARGVERGGAVRGESLDERSGELLGSAAGGASRSVALPTILDSAVNRADAGDGSSLDSSSGQRGDRTSPYGADCLVIARGLRRMEFDDAALVYDLKEKTTWRDLSLFLYGDESYVALLQSFNEEMFDAPEVGEIIVPTQDFTRRSGIVAERRPRRVRNLNTPAQASPSGVDPSGVGVSTGNGSMGSGRSAATQGENSATDARAGRRYKVQDGDSLSHISKRFYGTKHRWKEIYEANRDVLDSPDWVKPGMTLFIPGAKAADGVH